MEGRAWWSRAVHIIAARKQRKMIEEEARASYSPQEVSSDLLHQLRPPPIFHDLLIMPYYESIKETKSVSS
jgi:hypothetical protein